MINSLKVNHDPDIIIRLDKVTMFSNIDNCRDPDLGNSNISDPIRIYAAWSTLMAFQIQAMFPVVLTNNRAIIIICINRKKFTTLNKYVLAIALKYVYVTK